MTSFYGRAVRGGWGKRDPEEGFYFRVDFISPAGYHFIVVVPATFDSVLAHDVEFGGIVEIDGDKAALEAFPGW